MTSALPTSRRTGWVLAVAFAVTLVAFVWPFLVAPSSALADSDIAPLLFALTLPVLIGVVLAEMSDGGMDTKTVAMLGVLSALGAALRPLGAGTGGIEPIFFLIVLAGRVFGPGFGFVLGSTTLLVSAFLTAGVGPWLPYQMLAASWVGLGAGLLPPLRGKAEVGALALYGAIVSVVFGLAMNLSFWPFTLGAGTELSFVAGAPVIENLERFVLFSLATSLAWDLGRAATTATLTVLVGGLVLRSLRRAARRAAFSDPVVFGDPSGSDERDGASPMDPVQTP
jgi:energy-coupling factor transport system substrate-specific component